LVLENEDQSLAAEPGFHGESPEGGGAEVNPVRHTSDSLPEVLEQQSENGLALAPGPTQALSGVVKDPAGRAALETAPRAVIEFVHGGFDLRDPR
jgi:hypothetical protein